MARFLKALKGLQSLDSTDQENTPEVQSQSIDARQDQPGDDIRSTIPTDNRPQSAASQTIVMPEPVEPPQSEPSPDKDELVRKLTQQLTIALKQRDVVADEMLKVREKLESNDQRHEEEIVRLRDSVEGHQRSAKTIEIELKSIESELRQQLVRQQDEFVQRLGEVERQMLQQSERPLPTVTESATDAELREFQAELRQQMVREKEDFVRRLAEIESRIAEQAKSSVAKSEVAAQSNHNAELKSLQAEIHQQMVRQQQEFAQRIGDVEKQVLKQVDAPVAATESTPPVMGKSAASKAEIFKPLPSRLEADKQIPNTDAINTAMKLLEDPAVTRQFEQLADAVFGHIDFQNVNQPEVVNFGTCCPGQCTSDLVLRLAAWISRQGGDVLVIDGALRQKRLTERLGLRTSPGLFEFVRRETYRQDGTFRHKESGISFIPAGKSSFVLTASESDFVSLRDQLREIAKTNPLILIAGEGPDLSTSWLLAQIATKTYLQVELGEASGADVRAAVDCFLRQGCEPSGLVAMNALK